MSGHIAPILLGFFVASLPGPTLPANRVGERERRGPHERRYLLDLFILGDSFHVTIESANNT